MLVCVGPGSLIVEMVDYQVRTIMVELPVSKGLGLLSIPLERDNGRRLKC